MYPLVFKVRSCLEKSSCLLIWNPLPQPLWPRGGWLWQRYCPSCENPTPSRCTGAMKTLSLALLFTLLVTLYNFKSGRPKCSLQCSCCDNDKPIARACALRVVGYPELCLQCGDTTHQPLEYDHKNAPISRQWKGCKSEPRRCCTPFILTLHWSECYGLCPPIMCQKWATWPHSWDVHNSEGREGEYRISIWKP